MVTVGKLKVGCTQVTEFNIKLIPAVVVDTVTVPDLPFQTTPAGWLGALFATTVQ